MAADTWINPFVGLTRKHGLKCRSLDGVGIESYVQMISETIDPRNIIAASRANGSIIIFLDSLKSVEEVCAIGTNTIGGTYISVDPLVKPATKVILSGVPPFIPNSVIEKELHRYGRVVSTIRIIPLGCKNPEFKHVKSFRRQVYMLGNEEHLQGAINFSYEDRQYRIYLSTDEITCYKCLKKGHIQRNCRLNATQEQPTAANLDQTHTESNEITSERITTTNNNNNNDKTETTNQSNAQPDQPINTSPTHSNANDMTDKTSTEDSTGVTGVDDSPMSIDASPAAAASAEKTPPTNKGVSTSVWAVNDKHTTNLNKEVTPPLVLSTPDLDAIFVDSQPTNSQPQSNAPHAGGSQHSETDDTAQATINDTPEKMNQEVINEERVLTPPSPPEFSGESMDSPCISHDVSQEPAVTSEDDMDDSQSVMSDMSDISCVSSQDDISIGNDDLLSKESLNKFLADTYNSRKLIKDATRFCPDLKLLISSLTHMRKHNPAISSKERIRMQRMTARITKYYKSVTDKDLKHKRPRTTMKNK